jgi:hypothetical protein
MVPCARLELVDQVRLADARLTDELDHPWPRPRPVQGGLDPGHLVSPADQGHVAKYHRLLPPVTVSILASRGKAARPGACGFANR